MKYIECPQIYFGREKSLFLAGGISNCRIWQLDLVDLLKDEKLVLINPRRKNFYITREDIEEEQITYEHNHLIRASAVSFWFPSETVCPITLYELGKCTGYDKPIFVGLDPKYSRRKDIEIQLKLVRPEIKIVYSLEDLAKQIKKWARKN
jgi:hypothetical protein